MPSHSDRGLKKILSFAWAYEAMLAVIGYDKAMASFVRDYIGHQPDSAILDLGCGTAKILEYLHPDIRYEGRDFNEKYIVRNRSCYAGLRRNATFNIMDLSGMDRPEENAYDVLLLMSVLHHLNDGDARNVFEYARTLLKAGGRVLTYDPVILPDATFIERVLIYLDRGKNIRVPEQYRALVPDGFEVVQEVRDDLGWNIPGRAHIMVCRKLDS